MDELETFFAVMRRANPFIDNRVNGLTSDGVNVDDIHRAAFEQLTGYAQEALRNRRGLGVVLWGEAGIGKSHLLSRLASWAERDHRACAVYLHNLQASPENLPRSLLKSVVSILTRGQVKRFATTPLYDLVFALIKEALHHDQSVKHPWPVVERAYGSLSDRLSTEDFARAAPVDRAVFDVLYSFFRSVYRSYKTGDEWIAALAVRWFSGDYLDPDEARQLGLPLNRDPGMPVALADNQQIKQVLVALSRLALSRQQPFILCFDQVDNLDDEQFGAMSRFLEALIDSAPNLLIVTAGIQASLLRWRQMHVIQDSAWDRLTQFEVRLQRLSPMDGRHIIGARLQQAVEPFVGLQAVRQRLDHDALFPLGSGWAEAFFKDKIDLRPRDVINGAREGWQRQQDELQSVGGPAWLNNWGKQPPPANGDGPPVELTEDQIQEAIDKALTRKIAEIRAQHLLQLDSLPLDSDSLAGLVGTLLGQMDGLEFERPASGKPGNTFPFSLLVRGHQKPEHPPTSTGILFLVSSSAAGTTAALRWLVNVEAEPDRMLLVTEERSPLAFGAQPSAKGRAYYEELRAKTGFQHVELSNEQLAELAAFHSIVGMARSGDLEIELARGKTRRMSEQEVVESNYRQGRCRGLPVVAEFFN